jgi:outer membrane protein assembly factor BamE (lipoprotein component of BamABCDE complex)
MPRLVTFPLAALFALPLWACLYVPPVWDITDPNNQIDSIKIGETTRGEVLSLVGDSPSLCTGASQETSRWYRYSGTHSAGTLAYAGGDRKSLAETPWYLNIYFNDQGLVEAVDTNPPQTTELAVSGLTFEPSDEPTFPTAPPPELFEERSCAP